TDGDRNNAGNTTLQVGAQAPMNWVGKTRAYFSRSNNTETVFVVKIVALMLVIVYCVMMSVLTVVRRKRL
ncbi:MAG: hypothetical protein ACXVC1_04125, partial [Tumebacillaceae bacterium]